MLKTLSPVYSFFQILLRSVMSRRCNDSTWIKMLGVFRTDAIYVETGQMSARTHLHSWQKQQKQLFQKQAWATFCQKQPVESCFLSAFANSIPLMIH